MITDTTTKHIERSRAFRVDVNCLEKIWKLLEKERCKTAIIFRCSDQTTIECTNLAKLKEFQNAITRQIVSVEFNSDREGLRVSIKFWKILEYPHVEYSVRGEDSKVLHVSRGIEEIIDSTNLWYSRFVPVSAVQHGMWIGTRGVLLVISFAVLIWLITLSYLRPERDYSAAIVVTSVVYWVFMLPLLRITHFLFPTAIFAIGDGISREDNRRSWRLPVRYSIEKVTRGRPP